MEETNKENEKAFADLKAERLYNKFRAAKKVQTGIKLKRRIYV